MTDNTGPGARRRTVLYAGVAAAAGLAGAGVAWRKWSADASDRDASVLWPLSFGTPTGGTLEMRALHGKPLLLNFWATWCAPCVEEMPLLDAFFRESNASGWQVVGLAIDQPSAVRAFLGRTPVSYPVGLAGLGGSELSKQLGNLAGALPFTVVIGAAGEVLQRKIGRVTNAELAHWRKLR